MQFLDRTGVGTLWSICKEKFALTGHTHNYAGSGSPGGSANSAIGVVDYNQTGKTIQIGYSGTGITGDQIEYIAGYTDGSGNVNAKIKNVSKDALKSWLGLGSLAYSSSSIPTKLSQLTNDKGFVTGSVSGNTVTINGASTTWTNTWRGIQDNLTSTSTSDSLSANQGRVLKRLIDSKADSSDLSSYAQKSDAVKNISSIINKNLTGYGEQILKITYASNSLGEVKISDASNNSNGFMSISDKQKLDGIASGANNYSLPTASDTALGGIKVSTNANGSSWPICVDDNGLAQTKILGLEKHGNAIKSIAFVGNINKFTRYSYNTIDIDCGSGNDKLISLPSEAGTLALTSDIPTKTSQLTNDSTFLTSADKYTLPVASVGTLGGIRASSTYSKNDGLWPIIVDGSAAAYTHIAGLYKNNNGNIANITIKSNNGSIAYGPTTIQTYDTKNNLNGVLNVPKKFGTLALTDDIPDVSSLCKFNFVNSISECKSDRINFLLRCSDDLITLDPFDTYPDGTILIISISDNSVPVKHNSGGWFYEGDEVGAGYTAYIYKESLKLITKHAGKVYYYPL